MFVARSAQLDSQCKNAKAILNVPPRKTKKQAYSRAFGTLRPVSKVMSISPRKLYCLRVSTVDEKCNFVKDSHVFIPESMVEVLIGQQRLQHMAE